MKKAETFKQYLEHHRWLAIAITIVGGLLIGVGFSVWSSAQPYRERSVSRLLADLQKRDSALNLLHQKFWPMLPDRLQGMMGGWFVPVPAVQVRFDAARELRDRNPKPTNALPVLKVLLRDADMSIRIATLEVLQSLGTAGKTLAADVLALVGDQTGSIVDVRIYAITAIASIAPEDPATLRALLAALNEVPTNRAMNSSGPSAWNIVGVHHAAASALGLLARPGNGAVPALVAALKDAEPGFGVTVIDALAQAGSREPEVVPAVVASFERSLKLLASLPAESVETPEVPLNVSVLQSRYEWTMFRSRALAALQKLARPENGTVPVLLSALREADIGFASEILLALGQIGAMTPEVVPAIVSVMEHQPLPAAFDALAQMGPAAVSAIPNLLAMLQPLAQPQPLKQPLATLVSQAAPPPGLLPYRVELQRRTQLDRFSLPLQTLGKLGPAAGEAVPLLTTIIQVQTNLWRYEALLARWQITRDTAAELPALIQGLVDPDRDIGLRLVQCFQEMGNDGTDGLVMALGNADYEVRKNAAQALGEFGPSAERAVGQLVPLLEDPKNTVRFAAQNALKQIQPAQAEKWKAELRMPAIARKTKP